MKNKKDSRTDIVLIDRCVSILVIAMGFLLLANMEKWVGHINMLFTEPGSRFFPTILAYMLIIFGAILCVESFAGHIFKTKLKAKILNMRTEELEEKTEVTGEQDNGEENAGAASSHGLKESITPWRSYASMALVVVYVFLLKPVGFLISSIVTMVPMMALLKAKKWWHYLVLISLIVILNYIFTGLLNIRLPKGTIF